MKANEETARRRKTPRLAMLRQGRVWVLLLGLLLVVSAGLSAGCGEKAAEKALEKAMEKAAAESGQDVDVDIDVNDGSGSIKVSGSEGEAQWSAGSDIELPEGFPASLVPEGATVVGVYTSGGEQTVAFQTTEQAKKLLDYFIKALGDLGYEITDKMTAEQGGQTVIAIAGQKGDSQITVSGGQESGGAFMFSVMLSQGE